VRPCGMKTVPCDLPTEYSYFMRPGKARRKKFPSSSQNCEKW
jgi:hypothetical protein